MARPGVRGTFSLSGPSRPTVAPRLAPTLGLALSRRGRHMVMAPVVAHRTSSFAALRAASSRFVSCSPIRWSCSFSSSRRRCLFTGHRAQRLAASVAGSGANAAHFHPAQQCQHHVPRGLTSRSTGVATAGRLGPARGRRYIFPVRAKPSHRRAPVSSHVRPRNRAPCTSPAESAPGGVS